MTDTKQLPKQKLGNLFKSHSPPVYCWAWRSMAWNSSLVCLGHLPGCITPSILYPPQSSWGADTRQSEKERRPWCCANTVQKELKYQLSTLFWSQCYQHSSGHKEHGIITAAMKKINPLPARPSTMRTEKKQMPDFKKAEFLFIGNVSHPNTRLPTGCTHLVVLLTDVAKA